MIPYKNVLGVGYILLGIANAIQLILPLTLSYVYPLKFNVTQLTISSIGATSAILLSLILSAFAIILISIGWIIFGRSAGDNLWTVTGIVGILFIAFTIATVASFLYSLSLVASSILHGAAGSPYHATNVMIATEKYFLLLAEVYVLALLALVFGATFTINQIACLWTAGGRFRAVSLKASAVLMILSIVVMLLLVPTFLSTLVSNATILLQHQIMTGSVKIVYTFGTVSTFYWLSMLSSVLLMASYFIAGVAILTLKPRS